MVSARPYANNRCRQITTPIQRYVFACHASMLMTLRNVDVVQELYAVAIFHDSITSYRTKLNKTTKSCDIAHESNKKLTDCKPAISKSTTVGSSYSDVDASECAASDATNTLLSMQYMFSQLQFTTQTTAFPLESS